MTTQDWDPARYAAHGRFVSELGAPLVALLAPIAGERVLDLGCGDGALTVELLRAGCDVVGADASGPMAAAAHARGVATCVADGHALPFGASFDAVFSNAALHWMTRPAGVIDAVWNALRPGGRFVGEMGGSGNVATIVAALEAALARRGVRTTSPWFFPRPDEYRALLETRGFVIDELAHFPRPTPLPGDVGAWLETFARPYTDALPVAERESVRAEVVEALGSTLRGADGRWHADYVRLRFRATRPA